MDILPLNNGERQPGRYLEVTGGMLRSFEVKGSSPSSSSQKQSSPRRGRVSDFSRKSRRRLMNQAASLDYERLESENIQVLFITLTTSRDQWEDERRLVLALRKFRSFLGEQEGYLGAIVKKERGEKNGALHVHLMVFGTAFIPVNLMRYAWSKAMESEKPLRVGIERARSAREISCYLSKYVSKVGYEGKGQETETEIEAGTDAAGTPAGELAVHDGSPDAPAPCEGTGNGNLEYGLTLSKGHNLQGKAKETYKGYTGSRWWWVWNRESLPIGATCEVEHPELQAVAKSVRRVMRRWFQRQADLSEIRKFDRYYRENPQPVRGKMLQEWREKAVGSKRKEGKAGRHLRGFFEFINEKNKASVRLRSESFTIYASPALLERVIFWAMEQDAETQERNGQNGQEQCTADGEGIEFYFA